MDSVLDAAEGRRSRPRDLGQSRRGEARQRRHVDSRRLRPGDQPVHVWHGQPHARLHAGPRRRGQSLHVIAAGRGRRHRQDEVVLPDVAARHARLGFDADAGHRRHAVQRAHAQAGDDGDAQRLLLRAGSRHRRAPGHEQDRVDQRVGAGARRQGPAEAKPLQGSDGRGHARERQRAELSAADVLAGYRACSTSTRTTGCRSAI